MSHAWVSEDQGSSCLTCGIRTDYMSIMQGDPIRLAEISEGFEGDEEDRWMHVDEQLCDAAGDVTCLLDNPHPHTIIDTDENDWPICALCGSGPHSTEWGPEVCRADERLCVTSGCGIHAPETMDVHLPRPPFDGRSCRELADLWPATTWRRNADIDQVRAEGVSADRAFYAAVRAIDDAIGYVHGTFVVEGVPQSLRGDLLEIFDEGGVVRRDATQRWITAALQQLPQVKITEPKTADLIFALGYMAAYVESLATEQHDLWTGRA